MARQGLLIVYTGNGKGKTTAALGAVVRAAGHGPRWCVIQFVKGAWPTGEKAAMERWGDQVAFHTLGNGFTWQSKDLEADAARAREAWAFACTVLRDHGHDLVVLDELTYLPHCGFVPQADILEALGARPAGMDVIVTGRHAPRALRQAADLVTEMRNMRHPMDRGVRAREGMEY